MKLTEHEEIIKKIISESEIPVTYREMADLTGITKASVYRTVQSLYEKGLLERLETKGRPYFVAIDNKKTEEQKEINRNIFSAVANAKNEYEDIQDAMAELQKKVNDVDGKINQFYVNIISIMAVFVAIFALISINVKIVADVAMTISYPSILTCIIINVSAIVMIGVMLLILKLLIINPLKNKKK